MKHTIKILPLLLLFFCIFSCEKKGQKPVSQEDRQAKALLQGAWINDEDETLSFIVKGDTIFYADSTSMPVSFSIIGDSILLHGSNDTAYKILKQSANIFQFANTSGDIIKLRKATETVSISQYNAKSDVNGINQRKLIKRDTVVSNGTLSYHIYTQVNPTTYKVIHTKLNDDGISVDNIYYDNIIHLAIYNGSRRVYGSNFVKTDFSSVIPKDYIAHAVLSDIFLKKVDDKGFYLEASVCEPDSPTSYIINIFIDNNNKVRYSV